MHYLPAVLLGLVQGLTEFIPVSSSGHLIIMEKALGLRTGLVFDLALHLGTLLALVLVFAGDFWKMIMAWRRQQEDGKLVWLLGLGTVPAVLGGILLQPLAATAFRSTTLVGFNLILVAVVMLIVDRVAKRQKKSIQLRPVQAVAVGVAQAVALVPGVSRSGSTITAGLALGLTAEEATRFSFLLSVPIITGAIIKVGLNGTGYAEVAANPGIFVVGCLSALVSGYAAIKFMLRFVTKWGLAPFAYYRIALGLVVLLVSAKRWV
jgi:undecaprenyl-diphosphatase